VRAPGAVAGQQGKGQTAIAGERTEALMDCANMVLMWMRGSWQWELSG
jgi:hypothetical protein